MSDHAEIFQSLVQSWYHELIPVVRDNWGANINETKVLIDGASGLNVTISGSLPKPNISISKKLLLLLKVTNEELLNLGFNIVFDPQIPLDKPQKIIDVMLKLVTGMNPPSQLFSFHEKRFRVPGFDGYREQYVKHMSDQFMRRQEPLRRSCEQSGLGIGELKDSIEAIRSNLCESNAQLQLLECQVKYLFLHELAHVVLGHTTNVHTAEMEIEADLYAINLYLSFAREINIRDGISIDNVAFIGLFLSIGFAEELIDVLNRGIEYGIPDDFKNSYRPTPNLHPSFRARIREIYSNHLQDLNNTSSFIGSLMEEGVRETKQQFRLGITDYRYFKWYCRIRGIEAQASYVTKNMSPSFRKTFAEMIDLERGWDSIDIHNWGPLVDELFPIQWNEPMLGG